MPCIDLVEARYVFAVEGGKLLVSITPHADLTADVFAEGLGTRVETTITIYDITSWAVTLALEKWCAARGATLVEGP